MKAEYPIDETLQQAAMFINQFMAVKGDFLKGEFQVLGEVHSSDKYWWSKMVGFILEDLKDEILQTGLHAMVRAIQYVILQGSHHSFVMQSITIQSSAHSSP